MKKIFFVIFCVAFFSCAKEKVVAEILNQVQNDSDQVQNDSGQVQNDKGQVQNADAKTQNADEKNQKDSKMKIEIQVTNESGKTTKLFASLAENSSAVALQKKLLETELKLTLSEYGNFEKVGPLGFSLPKNDKHIFVDAGDIMLYQGNQITIFYDKNSWSYTPLGKLEKTESGTISKSDLKKIFGAGKIFALIKLLEN